MEPEKLTDWNPWWEDKELVNRLKGEPRPKYERLLDSIDIKEITVITGVRRSGKSTLMYQMIGSLLEKGAEPKQILFVNLEDRKLNDDTLDDIYLAYRENLNPDKEAYIFFDEIHRKEGWEHWLRKKYDLKTSDKFVISGSSSYLLKREYSTLLTGRILAFEVSPLTFEEYLPFKGIKLDKEKLKKGILSEKTKISIKNNLKEYMELGGFPEVVLKQEPYKRMLLKQYFDDILYKDIIDRYGLNSQKTKDLSLYFMTNFTGLISLRSIRNSLGLSYDTIKEYLSCYKDVFLFSTLDYFSYRIKEQKTRASKIYCVDNGLRNAVSFKFSKDTGHLAENLVFNELEKKDVYYWKNKGEVDFVVKEPDNSLTAINVAYSNEIGEREINSLLEFGKRFKKTKMLLITEDLEKKEQGIKFVPLWKWLLVREE